MEHGQTSAAIDMIKVGLLAMAIDSSCKRELSGKQINSFFADFPYFHQYLCHNQKKYDFIFLI